MVGIEQPELVFDAQDAPHRIIEPLGANRAVLRLAERAFVEALPAIGGHIHVEPGVDRLRAVGDAASRDLAVAVPIADDEALEPHLALERVGQQSLVAVGLASVPARKSLVSGTSVSVRV